MRRLLTISGQLTGVGPLIGAIRTSWESFDAYGTVPAGRSATLRLPAGRVSIAFEGGPSSRGVEAGVPRIAGLSGDQVPVRFMGRLQGPSVNRRSMFGGDRTRRRFATARVPAEGEFVVTAGACRVLLGRAGVG